MTEKNKNKSSNPVGRPSKYNEQVQAFADNYIDNYPETEELNGKTVPNSIPTSTELAYKLNVHRETIYNWAKENRQFFDTLEKIKQKQEIMITKYGLNRHYDSAFAKFIAVNVTGYRDKVEQNIEQKNIEIKIDKSDSEL